MSAAIDPIAPARRHRVDSAGTDGPYDRLATRLLAGPLSWAIGLLAASQLIQWIPHYLTWPLFPDHDVFASVALAWDRGELPYRDALTNNFPGTVYLFWILGKLFGWGRSLPLYAADALLLVGFGGVLLAWSRRRLGGALPGLIAYLSWLGFYLGLDYSLTAQRDWHAGSLVMMALMAAQGWSGLGGRAVSVLLYAAAATIRPQVGLFLPAWWLAIDDGSVPALTSWKRRGTWTIALGASFVLMLVPLIAAGALDDMIACIKVVSYGGQYNKVSLDGVRAEFQKELLDFRIWAPVVPLLLLRPRIDDPERRLQLAWLAAFAGALLYKPVSPMPHAYLIQPLMLTVSILIGLLAASIRSFGPKMAALQLAGIVLLLGLQATGRPRCCNLERSIDACRLLLAGGESVRPDLGRGMDAVNDTPSTEPPRAPIGYEFSPWAQRSSAHSWEDYRALLAYLRERTWPTTRVANVLRSYPPLVSATGRLSAFPAESVAWLILVRPQDERRFADALIDHPDSVVVWSPAEVGKKKNFRLEVLAATIREHYRPAVTFGTIEVWERADEANRGLADNSPDLSTEVDCAEDWSTPHP